MHYAALKGHFKQIPPKILTEKNLTLKNNDGDTPLHESAYNGHLNKIPKNLISQNNIFNENIYGNTILNFAMQKGHLDQIPYLLLKQNYAKIKHADNIETIMSKAKSEFIKGIKSKIKNQFSNKTNKKP